MFVDRATIQIQAGRGGDGLVSFRREKYVPFGGPNGGDGGHGGDVIVVADAGMRTLLDFRYRRRYRAPDGSPGGPSNRHGAAGENLVIRVPMGTVLRDADTGAVLADLRRPGESAVVARGGRGGRGNARFAGPVNQAPRLAERGEPGESRNLELELKLLADVGLVGLPNAGKSSLLSRITAAKPEVAAYPFTTLTPHLGVVNHQGESFVVADIPGLIEGAHLGAGLGHEFLRHVERSRVLLFVIDAAGTEGRSPLRDYDILNKELRLYRDDLVQKPRLVAANKVDLPEGAAGALSLRRELEPLGIAVLPVSALTGEGLDALLDALLPFVLAPEPEAAPVPESVYRPREAFVIEREGPDIFRVRGPEVERRVAMTDPANDEAVARLARYLKKSGIEDALRRAGAGSEAIIMIRDQEFELSPEE